jgi:predicted DNA-binding helix-hairpin-helix protein
MPLSLVQKLEILADAAKYDASCASSGAPKRAAGKGEIGSTGQAICHSYTPDGRCISLLKILLTNFCIYDCAYCVSRRSSNVPRARFSVDEVVRLTLDLYRRNCIEGLFLSSGIARGEDDTMADLVRVAKTLRLDHGYRGYIHLKTIPGADDALLSEAGLYADRLSTNVELPSERSLQSFAPEKSVSTIKKGLAFTRARIDQTTAETAAAKTRAKPPREQLLRVPGLGARSVDRILLSRRSGRLRLDDVGRLSAALSRARPFIVATDYHPGRLVDDAKLRQRFAPRPSQLSLFDEARCTQP